MDVPGFWLQVDLRKAKYPTVFLLDVEDDEVVEYIHQGEPKDIITSTQLYRMCCPSCNSSALVRYPD